jgi:carbon storage regulator CsrA
MLVLTRKNGESVWIGGTVRVEVLEIGGGRVKLGFSAPRDVDIQREEIRRVYPARVESWRPCSAAAELCT